MRDDLSDEMLMAYADGELDEAGCRTIEAAMAADADVAARVVAFQRSRRLARAAFAVDAGAVPDALRQAIEAQIRAAEAAAKPATAPAAGNVVTFPKRAAAPRFRRWDNVRAIAAALALMIAGGAGYMLAVPMGDGARGTLASLDHPDIDVALSTLPTGGTAPAADGTLRVIQTIKAEDGALCREFELARADGTAGAVACASGRDWQVRLAVNGAAGDAYQPASGGDTVDDFLAGLGAGAPLDATAEAEALEKLR